MTMSRVTDIIEEIVRSSEALLPRLHISQTSEQALKLYGKRAIKIEGPSPQPVMGSLLSKLLGPEVRISGAACTLQGKVHSHGDVCAGHVPPFAVHAGRLPAVTPDFSLYAGGGISIANRSIGRAIVLLQDEHAIGTRRGSRSPSGLSTGNVCWPSWIWGRSAEQRCGGGSAYVGAGHGGRVNM